MQVNLPLRMRSRHAGGTGMGFFYWARLYRLFMNIASSVYSAQMKAGIFKQFLRNRNLQKYFVLAVK